MKTNTILFTLVLIFPIITQAQWNFISLIGDSCLHPVNSKFTFENYRIGPHSGGYYIYKDEIKIDEEYCEYDCYVYSLYDLNDRVLFKTTVSDVGAVNIFRSIDSGKTWSWFGHTKPFPLAMIFINENRGYALCKYLSDENHIWINRLTGYLTYDIISGDSINLLYTTVQKFDTINNLPICQNFHSTGFRIQKDGVTIDYNIELIYTPMDVSINKVDQNLKFYPNPLKDNLIIESNQKTKIKIYDSFGRLVNESTISIGNNLINLSKLTIGFYYCNFQYKNVLITKSIIKE
jgi:hypothetical protein